MRELADDELGHSQALSKLKDRSLAMRRWQKSAVPDLKVSDYLGGPETPRDANLQDLLIFAMKREQQSVEFYARMTGVIGDPAARQLCESLVHWELKHKLRLETLYDDLFYSED